MAIPRDEATIDQATDELAAAIERTTANLRTIRRSLFAPMDNYEEIRDRMIAQRDAEDDRYYYARQGGF